MLAHLLYTPARAPPPELCQRTCFTSLPAHLLRSSASTHALHLCPHTSSEALPTHLPHLLRSYIFARAPPQELCQRTCSTSLPAHLLRSSASAHAFYLCPRTSSETLPAHLPYTSARAPPQELHLGKSLQPKIVVDCPPVAPHPLQPLVYVGTHAWRCLLQGPQPHTRR